MMLAEAPQAVQNVYTSNDNGYEMMLGFVDDENLSRSDRFGKRVVSLGPHQYINQAEGYTDEAVYGGFDAVAAGNKPGASMASLVELEHEKI